MRILISEVKMFEFTRDCFVGINAIDEKRIEYFAILKFALSDKNSPKERLDKILTVLKTYTEDGFRLEEEYMTEVSDKYIERHIIEHKKFKEAVTPFFELGDMTEQELEDTIEKLKRLMIRWLYSHLVSTDTLISEPVVIEEDNSNPFEFTSKYITGIEFVDEEHKKLFDIIKEANDVINNDFLYDKYDQIVYLLDQLLEYTKHHFSHEEEYMQSINYEGIEMQKKAHKLFIEKIENINLDEVDENQDEYLSEILDFLLNWLGNHILKVDMLIP